MMTRLLVILDGAPELPAAAPTTLEGAATPALDALCRDGAVGLLATTPPGLPPGSETGIPTLLGCPPSCPIGRGWVEAASAGVSTGPDAPPWRLDVHDRAGRRLEAGAAASVRARLAAALPDHAVRHLRGHRFLAMGAEPPAVRDLGGLVVTVWPAGPPPAGRLRGTVAVCGPGAAAGCARLLGAAVHVPPGATGDVDTDLAAKTRAAERAAADAGLVVVHLGGADEAAHRHDRPAKRAFLERVDRLVIAPLGALARRLGAAVVVTSDHGTDVDSGAHSSAPVPLVLRAPGIGAAGPDRLSEHALAGAAVARSPWAALGGVA